MSNRPMLATVMLNMFLGLPTLLILISAMASYSVHANDTDNVIEEKIACVGVDDIEVICGVTRPEDMVLLPKKRALIISEMGDLYGHKSGRLSLLTIADGERQLIYPNVDSTADNNLARETLPLWGDENCATPPDARFSPHGIDLILYQQQWRLLVVNHGGREAIEMFEVIAPTSTKDADAWRLRWRGCVIAPIGASLNDVAGTPDGGFVVSKMMQSDGWFVWNMAKALLRLNTGFVMEWHPQQGTHVIPGTEGSFVNGVSLSADGRYLFVNEYMTGEVHKFDRLKNIKVATAAIAMPDNSAWDLSGHLLVASHRGDMAEQFSCDGEVNPCLYAFAIVQLDPDTMTTKTIFEHKGAPMGAATVALDTGDWLYMGSYAGDRLIRIPYSSR